MSFEENIQSWVIVDNKIKNINDEIRELRNKRNSLETNILQHIKHNNLQNATIKISDGKLSFGISKQSPVLSLKFIKECLLHCINNNDQVELIMQYIKEQRSFKENEEIKRIYNEK
jgi:hypothetical protein